jgi:hypothetical protein
MRDAADLVREQGEEGPVGVGGLYEPSQVVFTRARTDAAVPHHTAAGWPTDRQYPATLRGGDLHPAARHVYLHAPVVLVYVPCPAAPPEGAVRLRMLNRLGGFLRRSSERAPHYALADLLVHGTVAPITQGGAHAIVAFGSRADQFQNLLGFDVRLLQFESLRR